LQVDASSAVVFRAADEPPSRMTPTNLLANLPASLPEERFDVLVDHGAFRLERIVSTAHATPPGEWLSQSRAEWVVLLSGSAELRFDDEPQEISLQPGDCLLIAANRRHRVERTDASQPTIWLALHYDANSASAVTLP
jgi:cupin 2 domain-containing protein